MRIKNMPRFIIAITILFVLILSLCSMISTKVFSYQAPSYEEVVVAYGDTLWGIASQLEGNINETIYHIKTINQLHSSEIYVGQILKVPIQ